MNPEKLKLLAEALGYKTRVDYDEVIAYGCPVNSDLQPVYDPESNPAQREEVLLWLLGKGWKLTPNGDEYEFLNYGRRVGWYSNDKDYTTALMMAAERELG